MPAEQLAQALALRLWEQVAHKDGPGQALSLLLGVSVPFELMALLHETQLLHSDLHLAVLSHCCQSRLQPDPLNLITAQILPPLPVCSPVD